MERFTSNYVRFFESVKTITPELFEEKNPTLPEAEEDKLTFFVKNWYPHMTDVSNGNMKYFESKGVNPYVFQNLKFLDLTGKVNQKNKDVIWEYLHSLYALSISSKFTKENFTNYEAKDSDTNEEKELMNEIKKAIENFPDLVANMVSWRREKKEREEREDKEDNSEKKDNTSNTPGDTPPIDEKFLENSALAKLAKEISDEINPNEILDMNEDMKDMDNPMKLFQSLLSGDKEKGVGKLMTTVCDKLKNKMESGEVNQEDLLSEATTLLQSMGGLGGGNRGDGKGSNSSPDLAGMMSMMQNLSSMSDLFNGPSGGGGSRRKKGRKIRRKMEKKLRKNNKKTSNRSHRSNKKSSDSNKKK